MLKDKSKTELSHSAEDYLEAIYNLQVRSEVARVKDIARELDVKMPSVTGALRSLASKGLVKHQPYESVELTEEGLERARSIAHRHSAVKEFLMSVLSLEEHNAEHEACGIEHAIHPDTLDKLLKFVDYVRSCGDKPLHIDKFRDHLKNGTPFPGSEIITESIYGMQENGTCRVSPTITSTKLSELCPGMKGRIAFVSGKGAIRKRLLDMGVTSNARIEVIRVAPFGDPIEIKIRGYHLSLRKSEAEQIEVEVE